jgi:outer membrane protein TolC
MAFSIRKTARRCGLVLLSATIFHGGTDALGDVAPLSAGRPDSTLITLPQAIQLAEQNYPLLKSKQSLVLAAKSDYQSVRNSYLPSLYVQHQYTYSTNNSVNGSYFSNAGLLFSSSGGIRKENDGAAVWGSGTSLLSNWDAIDFGKRRYQELLAKSQVNTASAETQLTRYDIDVQVIDSYLRLLTLAKIIHVQQDNLSKTQVFATITNASVTSGLRAGADSSLAFADVAKARLSLSEAQSSYQDELIHFRTLTGLETGDLKLEDVHAHQLPDPSHLTIVDSTQQHPLMEYYREQVQANATREKAVKREYSPTISLYGTAWARGSGVSNVDGSYHTDFSDGTSYQAYNYLFGVGLTWNLMDYFRVHQHAAAERFRTQSIGQEMDNVYLQLRLQQQQADEQLTYAYDQIGVARIQYEAAQQGYNQVNARYQSGLSSLVEEAQALYVLNRALVDQSLAIDKYLQAALAKSQASGNLNDIFRYL